MNIQRKGVNKSAVASTGHIEYKDILNNKCIICSMNRRKDYRIGRFKIIFLFL